MTAYWVPVADGTYAERDADELVWVDVMCKQCSDRLQRFCVPAAGGDIGVRPYRVGGQPVASPFRIRDGQPQWHLTSTCGHEVPVNLGQVELLLRHADKLPARRAPM